MTPMDARADTNDAKPLTHKQTRLIVFGVLLPLFMGSLDNTILASALPTIGRDFGEAHNLPWLITAYLLSATASMPLYGKIADIHGRRFTLRLALAIYMVASLICALAPSMLVLILGRALQGIGGGGLSSISVVVLGDVAAPKDRGPYYAYFSMTYTTAGACGPALGGFLAEYLHWSAIFWLNIPLALIALAITSTILRRLPRHERPHRLDVIGAILMMAASVSFMLGLNLAGVRYAWTSPPVLALFACSLLVWGGFVLRQITAPEPLIPLAILHDRVVRWAVTANSFGWGAIIGLNIFLPMYLQSVIGLSPTSAGLSLMVLMVTLNTSAGLGGQILGRVKHYKRLPMAALTVAIASVLVLALWADSLTLWSFELLLFLIGLGFGPMPSMNAVVVQNSVARHQLGIAVGTMSFGRNLFATMFVALLGALVLAGTAAITPGGFGPGHLGDALPPDATAAAAAFARVFYAVAACLAVSFFALLMVEEKPLQTGVVQEAK
jgi:EmrB/QacA subfamily drug resistance transporter